MHAGKYIYDSRRYRNLDTPPQFLSLGVLAQGLPPLSTLPSLVRLGEQLLPLNEVKNCTSDQSIPDLSGMGFVIVRQSVCSLVVLTQHGEKV